MNRWKIDKEIKELRIFKKWLLEELKDVKLNRLYDGRYSTLEFINNGNKSDNEVIERIKAYNMLLANLPEKDQKIDNGIRRRFCLWHDNFKHSYSYLLKKYRNKANKGKKHNVTSKKSKSFKSVISGLFRNNKKKKESKASKSKWRLFGNLKKSPKENNYSNERKNEDNKKMVVSQYALNFVRLTEQLVKQFDLTNYNLCCSNYEKIVTDGFYESLAPSIKNNFKCIKEKVDLVNKFITMTNKLNVNNVDYGLYGECTKLYKQLQEKCNNDILEIIPSSTKSLLKECEDKLIIRENNINNERIIASIQKMMNKLVCFRLVNSNESIEMCEKLLQDVLYFLINLSKDEKNLFNNQALSNKISLLLETREALYSNYKIVKFTKVINDSFSFKNTEEIKYDENKIAYCIKLYNSLNDEEKKDIPRETLWLYEDALRFNSVLTLKTILSLLDVEKCIKTGSYREIYDCCKIYDRFHSKIRGGKLKGGNDMLKRRSQGKKEIDNFPVEIKNKLLRILDIRNKNTVEQGVFNVSYFDAVVNRKKRDFAFVSIMIGDDEVETITVPLSNKELLKDEAYSEILKRYPNIDIERINFEESSRVYKKVL